MLFDLRGRGRRRTIQVIYLGLAALFLIGFVGFGVGGGFGSGGLLNAINSGSGGSGGSSINDQITTIKKQIKLRPSDASLWAKLTRDEFLLAGQGSNYNQATSSYTQAGLTQLRVVKNDWDRYLQLNPDHPDQTLVQEMPSVLGPSGLNQPAALLQALEIQANNELPTASAAELETLYASIAQAAYQAHNFRQGDLASVKAVSLAPSTQQALLKSELASIRRTATGATGAAGAAPATPANGATTVQGNATQTVQGNATPTVQGNGG